MTASRAPRGTPVIGIVGWKNSGKTTLAVRLIEIFSARGFRVASIKHAHHSFQIDENDTDSARHRRAGSAQVAIVSQHRWALVTETGAAGEPDFHEVVAMLGPADLVIVEGYKTAAIPKIEARRAASAKDKALASGDPDIIAIAADAPDAQGDPLPVFQLDDVTGIADFITETLSLVRPRAGS